MSKSMYGLMLSDEVIEKIDEKAAMLGMSRSALINEVLAQHFSYITPERRTREIYRLISSEMMQVKNSFRFLKGEDESAFAAVTALKYKYNPSIKYNLLLYYDRAENLGEMRAAIRTQNASLLELFSEFCGIWNAVERAVAGVHFECTVGVGSYRRVLKTPDTPMSTEALANLISSYISLFDSCFKLFLSGGSSAESISAEYRKYMAAQRTRI